MVKNINKKAVSPVITTVLLVLIVLILAMLIFLWARGFLQERIEKFDEPVERACERIAIQTSYLNNNIRIVNQKDIPIYNFGFVTVGGAQEDPVYKSLTNNRTLKGGSTGFYDYDCGGSCNSGDKIQITPVILGKNEDGGVEPYPCSDNKHTLIV